MGRVVVIGASLSGSIAACYLRLRFPDLEVVSIQPPGVTFPIVGESLTEFSTLMLHEIGLGSYLEEQHFHKYGLTFYFKEKIDDPADFTYATHEAERIPPMPSNQVNRFTLAKRLRERAAELGVRAVDGRATDVAIGDGGAHRVVYADPEGRSSSVEARWIVDASGRRRFLATRLGLKRRAPYQRSSFWFRLEGFDRSILRRMVEVKTPHHCFDSYYVTHHFFGRHNWIWAIPMRGEGAGSGDLISIGIVYRPDLYGDDITTLDAFLSRVGAEHPVVADLVRSGRVVDTNTYRNYFYETARSYSLQGWFIVGDAGDTVDPLYSTGIAMTSIQVKQVAAMVDADRQGRLTDAFVADLEALYKATRDSLQNEVSTLYEVMGDPLQAHIRMHCASAFYFFFLLPSWLNGYVTDPTGARVITRILQRSAEGGASLRALLSVASRRAGPRPASEIPNLYAETVNWELRGPGADRMSRYLARGSLFFARTRFEVLKRAGWHRWPHHLRLCARDLLTAALFGLVVRRRSIKEIGIVKRMMARARTAAAVYASSETTVAGGGAVDGSLRSPVASRL